MGAASHALITLLVAVGVLVGLPTPATAQAAAPLCPAAIGDQPLTVAVPFSGTPRPVADGGDDVDSISLLCAYGEGVRPSAEIRVTWSPGATPACADIDTVVGAELAAGAFRTAARELAASIGGVCAGEDASTLPVRSVAAVAAALVLAGGAVLVRLRRRRVPTVDAGPEPEPAPEVVRPAAPAPDRPSLQPVLAHLTAADGRHFARSSAGQWLTVAAVAYGSGHDEAGDLARVGARQARSTRLPARPELAALARVLAHQQDAVGR